MRTQCERVGERRRAAFCLMDVFILLSVLARLEFHASVHSLLWRPRIMCPLLGRDWDGRLFADAT